jgi:hypothetical protein
MKRLPNKNHWSERGRAASVVNADALGRPRRSVLAFGVKAGVDRQIVWCFSFYEISVIFVV